MGLPRWRRTGGSLRTWFWAAKKNHETHLNEIFLPRIFRRLSPDLLFVGVVGVIGLVPFSPQHTHLDTLFIASKRSQTMSERAPLVGSSAPNLVSRVDEDWAVRSVPPPATKSGSVVVNAASRLFTGAPINAVAHGDRRRRIQRLARNREEVTSLFFFFLCFFYSSSSLLPFSRFSFASHNIHSQLLNLALPFISIEPRADL